MEGKQKMKYLILLLLTVPACTIQMTEECAKILCMDIQKVPLKEYKYDAFTATIKCEDDKFLLVTGSIFLPKQCEVKK